MSILKIKHSRDYTTIANSTLRDKQLSFKARGLLAMLLSYPSDWDVNTKHLASQSDKDGRDAVQSAVRELVEAGYIVRSQERESGKFGGATYDVFEVPQTRTANGKPGGGGTEDGFAVDGKAADGKTAAGKSDTTNKRINEVLNKQNTDQYETPYSPPQAGDAPEVVFDAEFVEPEQEAAEQQPEPSMAIALTDLDQANIPGEVKFSAPRSQRAKLNDEQVCALLSAWNRERSENTAAAMLSPGTATFKQRARIFNRAWHEHGEALMERWLIVLGWLRRSDYWSGRDPKSPKCLSVENVARHFGELYEKACAKPIGDNAQAAAAADYFRTIAALERHATA